MKQTEQNEFFLIETSVCTTNKNSRSQMDLGAQLSKFMSNNLKYKIQEKISDDLNSVTQNMKPIIPIFIVLLWVIK